MNLITITSEGRFAVLWNPEDNGLAISKKIEGTDFWFGMTDEGSLADLEWILSDQPNMSKEEIVWLVGALQSAETWRETLPYNWKKYDEVGVSF